MYWFDEIDILFDVFGTQLLMEEFGAHHWFPDEYARYQR
jgi:hypothetical protein